MGVYTHKMWGEMLHGMFASAVTFRRDYRYKLSFVFLNQVDLLLTIVAVSLLGLYEINSIMRAILGIPLLLILVKTVIPVLIAWAVPGKLLLPSIMLLICIVAWNIKELAVILI